MVFIKEKLIPMEEGLSYEGSFHNGQVKFLYDLRYKDKNGNLKEERHIFSKVFELIEQAEDFIVLDFFLFNDDYDHKNFDFQTISRDLANKIIKKKKESPNIKITLITDPINTFYGSYVPEHFLEMKEAGVEIIITDLNKVKDSNPLYSNLYRAYFKHISPKENGKFPNIFRPGERGVSLGSYLDLLNFKANHRKILMNEKEGMIISANPHDGSSLHSNIGFSFTGKALEDLLESEKAIAKFSKADSQIFSLSTKDTSEGPYTTQVLTEEKIKDSILRDIKSSGHGYKLFVGAFYIGDRDIVNGLKKAAEKGVDVRLVLDLNKDAFGVKKIGIPNKQVAAELVKSGAKVRWYKTNGEQYHAKIFIKEDQENLYVVGGSANFTRRNLQDLNLETDLRVEGDKDLEEMKNILEYWDRIWENQEGIYTLDYEDFSEDKLWKNILYYIQEVTGLSTF